MFKVGDKVKDYVYGEGVVSRVDAYNDQNVYRVTVEFKRGPEHMTMQGKHYYDSPMRTLFFCGPNGEFLEERPKKMITKEAVGSITGEERSGFVYIYGGIYPTVTSKNIKVIWEEEE